jgi:energy-coupling factor transporter ATP-binding protein EcfA2
MAEELPEVERFERQDFIENYFHYKPGEHVTFVGATGSGKTYLAYQLLNEVTTPELPGIVLVMKPVDETASKWNKKLGYKIIRSWPPMKSIWEPKKPRGYTLWPGRSGDFENDELAQYEQFNRAIRMSYANKKSQEIIFADELYSLCKELGLEKTLIHVWTKGRSMKLGLWGATQKPTHVPLWAYNQAQHLFLSYEPDMVARKRFGEFGGVNPKLVEDVVSKLDKHEWLYIRRDGPVMAIVGK